MLSPLDGHKAVLAAMSDYRIEFEETFRFQELVSSLQLPDIPYDTPVSEGAFENDEGVWEARTASLALINALTNCPVSLEDRVLLREELGRRGLNEAIVVRILIVYIPPNLIQKI